MGSITWRNIGKFQNDHGQGKVPEYCKTKEPDSEQTGNVQSGWPDKAPVVPSLFASANNVTWKMHAREMQHEFPVSQIYWTGCHDPSGIPISIDLASGYWQILIIRNKDRHNSQDRVVLDWLANTMTC